MNKLKLRYGLGAKKNSNDYDYDQRLSSPQSSPLLVLPTTSVVSPISSTSSTSNTSTPSNNATSPTNNNSKYLYHHLQRKFSPNKSFLFSITQKQGFRLRTPKKRINYSNSRNNASRWKYSCRAIFYLLLKLVTAFVFYACCMSFYNTRSIMDPCKVANDSMKYLEESDKSSSKKSNLPKIIHQQWKSEHVPEKFAKWRKKWFDLYPEPEYTHMLWTDTNGRELIEEHYPWFIETYDDYKHNINRADAVRYFILHHYGGIYADLDYEPLVNFYNYLPQDRVAMVESPYYWNEKTQNCLMTSPKSDIFWDDLFLQLVANSEKEEVLEATGPQLLDSAIQLSSQETFVLPCENFQRVPLGEYGETLFTTIIDREIMFRLKPISKHCGLYSDLKCQFGRHHNTVSYRTTSGRVLWISFLWWKKNTHTFCVVASVNCLGE